MNIAGRKGFAPIKGKKSIKILNIRPGHYNDMTGMWEDFPQALNNNFIHFRLFETKKECEAAIARLPNQKQFQNLKVFEIKEMFSIEEA